MFNRKSSIQDMDAYVEARLSEYLDGTLPDKERELVQAHLAASERARASLEALRYTVNLLKQTPAPALPRQFTLPVTSRAPAQSAPGWLVWGLRGVGVAATAAFVILLVATLTRPSATDTTAMLPAAAPQQPPAVIAMNATEVPTAELQQSSVASEANPTQVMVTVEPNVPSSQPIPITETPDTVQKAQPAQDSSNAVPTATRVPPQPTAPPPTEAPQATVAAAAAQASGVTNASPEFNAPTETSEAFSQRGLDVTLEGEVLITELKVRQGPGTQYPTIGSVRFGERIMVTGRSSDDAWLKIEFLRNRKTRQGWISSSSTYIRLNGKQSNLPVVEFGPPGTETPTPTPTETLTTEPPAPTTDGSASTPEPSLEPEIPTLTSEPPTATPEPTILTSEPPPTEALRETATPDTPAQVATETPVPPTGAGREGTPPPTTE